MGKSLIITTGGGTDTSEGNPNITPTVMLAGYTAYNKEGEIIEGSMLPKRLTQSLSPGGSVTIPSGWYDGTNSKVAAQGLSVATNGVTAKKENILSGYTGWRDGSQLTGTMSNRGTTNGTLSANGTYTVPVGWHNGSGKVTQSLSTQGATTITPGTSQKTVVAASKWVTGNQIVAGNANLVAGNIKKGVTIFGVTGKFNIYSGDPITIFENGQLNTGKIARINMKEAWNSSKNYAWTYVFNVNGHSFTNAPDPKALLQQAVEDDSYSQAVIGDDGLIHSTYEHRNHQNTESGYATSSMTWNCALIPIPQVAGKIVYLDIDIAYLDNVAVIYYDPDEGKPSWYPTNMGFSFVATYYPYPTMICWASTRNNTLWTPRPSTAVMIGSLNVPYPSTANKNLLSSPQTTSLRNSRRLHVNWYGNETLDDIKFGARANMISWLYIYPITGLQDTSTGTKYNNHAGGGSIGIRSIRATYEDLPWEYHWWTHCWADRSNDWTSHDVKYAYDFM